MIAGIMDTTGIVTKYIWYRNGAEIDAFCTKASADAAVRRANKYGFESNISIDPDGRYWNGDVLLPDVVLAEQRTWDGI